MASIFKSKYTGEQIEEILDKANNVTDVQANNGEPTSEDLSTLKIGDVNYKISEPTTPEEPTVVEANPSGDATAELSKLKVGETIYSIPQGSGGGDGSGTLYIHQLLFSGGVGVHIVTTNNVSLAGQTAYNIFTDIIFSQLIYVGDTLKVLGTYEDGIINGYVVLNLNTSGTVTTMTLGYNTSVVIDDIYIYQ